MIVNSINLALGDRLQLASEVNVPIRRVEARFKINNTNQSLGLLGYTPSRFLTDLAVRRVTQYFGRDEIIARFNSSTRNFNAPNSNYVFDDGDFHTVTLIAADTNMTAFRDGAQIGSPVATTEAFSKFDCFGGVFGSDGGEIQSIKVYTSVDTSELIHHWDANSSDITNTGAQPILVDIVGGNHATGVNYPIDGTAFNSVDIPNEAPVITLTSSNIVEVEKGSVWDSSSIQFTAIDPEDGDIKQFVVIDDSAVNTSVVGDYNVTLNVADSENLSATEVSLIVRVIPIVTVDSSHRPTETITFVSDELTPTAATLTDSHGNVLTLTNVTATTATIPDFISQVVSGVLFGECVFEITDGVTSIATNFTLDAPTGFQVVTVGATPNTTNTGIAYNWLNDPVQGDQVLYPNTITLDSDLNVAGDAGTYTLYVANQNDPLFEQFNVVLGEASGVDTLPENLGSFTSQTSQALSKAIESNTITVLDVDSGVDIPVSISNGLYAISTDGGSTFGAWTSAASNVRLNDQIKVRLTTSDQYETQVNATLNVGGVSRTFSATTVAEPINNAPVIALTSPSTIVLNVGDALSSNMITFAASDAEDGDLTANVVLDDSAVNVNAPGTYSVTLNVSDSKGLAAQEVVVNVVVEEEVIVPGIQDIVGVVTAGGSFSISISGLVALAQNEAWSAFITIANAQYPLTVNSETLDEVNVTAPDDLPVASVADSVLTLRRMQISA